jgi:SAM-dependent methyltransferase
VIDGVPLIVPHGLEDLVGVLERDLDPEVAALLALPGPDDAPYARLLEHLSIYLDAHWGDRAVPPPDGPAPPFGLAALAEKIAALASTPVARAVELGCSAGRIVAELARGAEWTVGVDLQFASLRRARRLLAGAELRYARRVAGRHYAPATIAAPPAAPRVALVCADALDPPLVPGAFQRVVALNLLDAVRTPGQVLSVVDGLCAPGGEVILASPFAWQSGVVDDRERIGGADPAAEVARRLREGEDLEARYEIEDEADLPWSLRRDARGAVCYSTRWIRARKARTS